MGRYADTWRVTSPAFWGVSNLELVANGTIALQLAIKALGLKGDHHHPVQLCRDDKFDLVARLRSSFRRYRAANILHQCRVDRGSHHRKDFGDPRNAHIWLCCNVTGFGESADESGSKSSATTQLTLLA